MKWDRSSRNVIRCKQLALDEEAEEERLRGSPKDEQQIIVDGEGQRKRGKQTARGHSYK